MQDDNIEIKNKVEETVDTESYAGIKPVYETSDERETRIMNECRNAPQDIDEVKAAEKINVVPDDTASRRASVAFKAAEGLIAATAWPAAVIAACFIAIWVIIGNCALTALISSGVILALAGIGDVVKSMRLPKFALNQDEFEYRGKKRAAREPEDKNYRTIAKVKRRHLRSGEYAHVLSSIVLVVAFIVLSVFMPIEISYFVAMVVVFATFWALGSEFVSSSTPYCDVYDIEWEDGEKVAVISFDTPLPNEKRYFTPIDGNRAYMLALRQTTKDFLAGDDSTFRLNDRGIIVRK